MLKEDANSALVVSFQTLRTQDKSEPNVLPLEVTLVDVPDAFNTEMEMVLANHAPLKDNNTLSISKRTDVN